MIIYWFRQDLRLSDNPALFEAAKHGKIIPVFILDDDNANEYSSGGASRVWLHHTIKSLNDSLDGKLLLFKGDAKQIMPEIARQLGAKAVYWNRCYELWRIERDKEIKIILEKNGITAKSYNGSLLWEPWEALKDDGTPYKVFTPYYKKASTKLAPREPLPKPEILDIAHTNIHSENINSLNLLPEIGWDKNLVNNWQISEQGAKECLNNFLDYGINDYKEGRNFPAKDNTSHLSPYLHFGQISPNQIWHAARFSGNDKNIENFCTELGWREFSYNLLFYFPNLPKENLQSKFNNFPWQESTDYLKAWQTGMTGYPIIDAGMRELWQTGYMHNRVRMIVGSFLVKNLLLHWHHGERWFWDCLFDADLANNSASWQWIAGCGADAAPYFRIFNPVTQGIKFDENGKYTRKYVPELANMPDKYLFSPWEAPVEILKKAGVTLGQNYPKPIVDIKESREVALAAYNKIKQGIVGG